MRSPTKNQLDARFGTLHRISTARIAWLLAATAAGLALLGATPMADNATQRTLAHVAGVAWADVFAPFDLPHPMKARAVRPLSLVLVKSYNAVFGESTIAPGWLYFAKALLSFFLFAWASRIWLRVAGLNRFATIAALAATVISPSLFSGWHLLEFDGLGAAATLYAGALIGSDRALRSGQLATCVFCLSVAYLLKESTALVQFNFAAAGLLTYTLMGRRLQARRYAIALGFGLLLWLPLTYMVLRGRASLYGEMAMSMRLGFLVHNPTQLLYMASPYAGLLMLGAPRAERHWSPWLVIVLAFGALLAPIVSVYSHYETLYYSPRWPAWIGAGLLAAGLVRQAAPPWGRPGPLLAATSFLATMAAFGLAGLLSPTAREDLAARLFVALVPALYALGAESAMTLWRRCHGLGVAAAAVLALSLVWYPLAQLINFTSDWHARRDTEAAGKAYLATLPLDGAVVIFNHFVQYLGPFELRGLGAPNLRGRTRFVLLPDWLDVDALPERAWDDTPADIKGERAAGSPFYLFWFGARSLMSERANAALHTDMSWAHQLKHGLFFPAASVPHSHPEDQRMTTYRSGPTPLERIVMATAAGPAFEKREPFFRVPELLTELPRRTWAGVPLIERYYYRVWVTKF
jgi:hypothetical protein